MRDRNKLKPYQNKSVKFLLTRKHGALWLDMGLGKTVITLTTILDLKAQGLLEDRPVLLVSTIRIIYSVWRQEARLWKHTRRLKFSMVHGSMSERMAALRKPADIYLMNYDNLKWLASLTELDRPNFGVFVADESSRLKAHNTKRFRAVRDLLHLFDRRWLLTGTPAPTSLMNLWSQVFILDEGQRLGRQFEFFKQRFFEPSDWEGHSYQPRPRAERTIHRLVAPLVLRLDAADYVKMPKIIPNTILLDLPEEVRGLYNEMERRMFLQLDSVDVEVFNAATLTAKCWQFANGAVYGTDRETNQREWRTVHNMKLDALDEVLEEAEGNPVLIPYWFRSDLARLQQRFGKRFGKKEIAHIGSGVKPGAADKLIVKWNHGDLPALLVHFITAAHGLNIQAGGHILFFFSQTWSSELNDQLIKRLARPGQKFPVIVHRPIMRDTVDEAIQDSMLAKAATQGRLFNALRRYHTIRDLL